MNSILLKEKLMNTKANIQTNTIDESLRQYMLKVYNYMAAGIGISGVVAYLITTVPVLNEIFIGTFLFWICLFAPLVMLLFFSKALYSGSPRAAQIWFWIFCALEGVGITAFTMQYTTESIFQIFFITAAMFAGISLWGYTTKRDLSGLGMFFMMALIGLIVAMIINIFVMNTMFGMLISSVAVLIFSGLIAYDTQLIKNQYLEQGEVGNSAICGALSLYLDFLNLFIHLLALFGVKLDD